MSGEMISVIVPVYNLQNYIEKTVDSICNQTYKNIEIILVDDGSTDNSSIIIDKIAEKDVRVKVIHKENGGVTSARFRGIKSANGEWITFVDGDDFIEPEMYEVLINNAKKHNADISHCGYQMVFPSRVDMYYGSGRLVGQDNITGLRDLLQGNLIEPSLCNKLFRKVLFDNILKDKKIDYSIKINEDLLMNYYLFSNSERAIFLDACYYHYILRDGSAATSAISESKLRDPLRVLKIIKEESKNNNELVCIANRRIIAQLIGLSTMSVCENKKLIMPYRKNARRELRSMLPHIVKGKYSSKQKLMSFWVSVWPLSYRLVHFIYAKLTGVDKKYNVQ